MTGVDRGRPCPYCVVSSSGRPEPMEVSKREILIPLIIGGLLGCSVALLQRRGVDFHYPKPIQLEVLPFKKWCQLPPLRRNHVIGWISLQSIVCGALTSITLSTFSSVEDCRENPLQSGRFLLHLMQNLSNFANKQYLEELNLMRKAAEQYKEM